MTDKKKEEKAFDKYKQVVDELTKREDKKGLQLVKELVEKCLNYIRITVEMETTIKILRFREISEEELKATVSNMDMNKSKAHDLLISQLHLVNRYIFRNNILKNNPDEGIFSLGSSNLDNRDIIGDWAYFLVSALYKRGIVKEKYTL